MTAVSANTAVPIVAISWPKKACTKLVHPSKSDVGKCVAYCGASTRVIPVLSRNWPVPSKRMLEGKERVPVRPVLANASWPTTTSDGALVQSKQMLIHSEMVFSTTQDGGKCCAGARAATRCQCACATTRTMPLARLLRFGESRARRRPIPKRKWSGAAPG